MHYAVPFINYFILQWKINLVKWVKMGFFLEIIFHYSQKYRFFDFLVLEFLSGGGEFNRRPFFLRLGFNSAGAFRFI